MTEDQLRAVIRDELAPVVEMMRYQQNLTVWLHTDAKKRGANPPLPPKQDVVTTVDGRTLRFSA